MPIVNLANLLGQPETSAFLRGVVGSGRLGNAYLFHGPAGVGKGTAALAFARALLCEHAAADPTSPAPAASLAPSLFDAAPARAPGPDAAPVAPPADDACGRCRACLKSAALQHPDLKFLFPVSGEEKELDNTIGETLAALRQDPWFVFQYEKAASIRLSLTRELLRELAYKPYEATRRVVVVRDAERMREDQYSALLKSIEEPGASTVWVLTTARLARLPATIRSRCQRVRFAPLGEPLIAATLENGLTLPRLEARMLAALSGGSLARAIVMRDQDPVKARDEALELLEPALRGDGPALWKTSQAYTRFGKAGRETLRRLIEFHHLWLRDLMRARYDAPREALVNRDRESDLRRQAARINATEIRRRLMVLEEMLRAIEGNVSADLTLFSGAARIAGERIGEGGWPAHATGRWDY
jgi:DNA polymerase-3 subunit delta'